MSKKNRSEWKVSSPRQVIGCDWEAADGQFFAWDDGHIPHPVPKQSTLLVCDSKYHHCQQQQPPPQQPLDENIISYQKQNDTTSTTTLSRNAVVHVINDGVHESLCDALYQYTTQQQHHQNKPWGSYIRLDQIQEEWNHYGISYNTYQSTQISSSSASTTTSSSSWEHICIPIAAAYLHQVMKLQHDNDNDNENIVSDIHGIAIWGLAATVGSQVPYHLDYAEQLRYQYNIIVPPIWAGTFQCSPLETSCCSSSSSSSTSTNTSLSMMGGHYCVHTGGLDHYERHGFKGKKSGHENVSSLVADDTVPGQWYEIPYRYNRMIVHRGDLPHLSTPIQSLPTGISRVIVGFNVFRHDVGPFVERAPEHSSAFRRRITLQSIFERTLDPNPHSSSSSSLLLSLESVRTNPLLTKLLIQAKRHKIKQDYLLQQRELDKQIDLLLQQQSPRTIESVIECLLQQQQQNNGTWPNNANDLHVHIHHRCIEKRWYWKELIPDTCNHMKDNNNKKNKKKKELLSRMTLITLNEDLLESKIK